MVRELVVVLRGNLALQSDVALARAELAALAGEDVEAVGDVSSAELDGRGIDSIVGRKVVRRRQGPVALVLSNVSSEACSRILLRSAFGQEIVAYGAANLPRALAVRRADDGETGFCLHALLELSDALLKDVQAAPDANRFMRALAEYLVTGAASDYELRTRRIDEALGRRNTLHLAHNLHVYKAKFFPRFVGALLNIYGPPDGGVLVEPFAGSGTALFEAATRGLDSVGFDLDPISALISSNKVTPLMIGPRLLHDAVRDVVQAIDMARMSPAAPEVVHLPDEIRRRLEKRAEVDGVDWVAEIEEDAAIVRAAIEGAPQELRGVFNTLLSDALTKKVRYRFVGVGNGRYTFAVTKERVATRFRKKVSELPAMAAVLSWVDTNVVPLGAASASVGDARHLPLDPGSADLVITSPPYLPASSGREHYALARAIPLSVLRVASTEQLDALVTRALGSVPGCDCPPDPIMHAPLVHVEDCPLAQSDRAALPALPEHATELLEFLRRDPHRRLKFKPTLDYLLALKDVLSDGLRLLKPGGVYVMVLPRESIFYESESKDHLFVCRTADMVRDLALTAGFEYEGTQEVQLLKLGTPNARPRSSDAYFESAIVLRAPASVPSGDARRESALAASAA